MACYGFQLCILYIWFFISSIYFLEFEWETDPKYVRIYFDTPTFDRIEKDRAAKFTDMLSAIGGTMGLLDFPSSV